MTLGNYFELKSRVQKAILYMDLEALKVQYVGVQILTCYDSVLCILCLLRWEMEVLCYSLHPLLSNNHGLRPSKPTEGSVGWEIRTTHLAHSTEVGNLVYIVSLS